VPETSNPSLDLELEDLVEILAPARVKAIRRPGERQKAQDKRPVAGIAMFNRALSMPASR
jgi:hypothetical protein